LAGRRAGESCLSDDGTGTYGLFRKPSISFPVQRNRAIG
jgi:hypothetical protein